jgi:predicted RNase H-like HicB family nuclease
VIDLPYSPVIEATNGPGFFGFFSPELEGFTGVGNSVEDCPYQARRGMKEHIELLTERNLPVAFPDNDPTVMTRNECRATVRAKASASGV